MEIYFHQLARKLDKESPGWRKRYVIFLDGAVSLTLVVFLNLYLFLQAYHQSEHTQRVMETLQLPILLVAPHGYR